MGNMYYYVIFALGLGTFAIFTFLAYRSRKKIEHLIRLFGAGVILTNIILVLPTNRLNLPYSFFFSLQAGSLNADYEKAIESTVLLLNEQNLFGTVFLHGYYYFLVMICVLSPILFGGIVLTLFEGLWEKIIYHIFKMRKDVYYFSELNERSFMLAQSIKEHKPSAMLVFCNYEGGSLGHLTNSAKEHGFTLLKASQLTQLHKTKRCRWFFEISDNMDTNLDNTKALIQAFTLQPANYNFNSIKIFLFSDQTEAEIVLNSINKMGLEVVIINEKTAIAYDLLYQKPLYLAIKDKLLSIAIIGSDSIAVELLKACVWCGQLGDDSSLNIRVVDQQAGYCRNVLQKDCPELLNGEYDISFVDADIHTIELEHALGQYCADANYIMVCAGDDEQTIKTALYLRSYYIKNSPDFHKEPIICAAIYNQTKSMYAREFTAIHREHIDKKGWDFASQSAQNYNIFPFGSQNSIYSYDFLLNSEIEKLALNGHAVYELSFSENQASEDEIRKSYHISETDKRSSRANAIHIKYKLFALGYQVNAAIGEPDCSDELIKRLKDPQTLLKLTQLEHLRWNAFVRSEGYVGASAQDACIYKQYTNNSHKHLRAKMHACICTWDELDEISRVFGSDFKESDKNFISKIPYILGILDDKQINISSCRYGITAIKQ